MREEMVRDGVGEEVEPEVRELGENLAFVWDARAEDVIEGRDAVGGDEDEFVSDGVEVADLAACGEWDVAEVSGEQCSGH